MQTVLVPVYFLSMSVYNCYHVLFRTCIIRIYIFDKSSINTTSTLAYRHATSGWSAARYSLVGWLGCYKYTLNCEWRSTCMLVVLTKRPLWSIPSSEYLIHFIMTQAFEIDKLDENQLYLLYNIWLYLISTPWKICIQLTDFNLVHAVCTCK